MSYKIVIFVNSKIFSMEKTASGRIYLIEAIKGFKVALEFLGKVRRWLIDLLKLIDNDSVSLGFKGKIIDYGYEFIFRVKQNKGVKFISIRSFSYYNQSSQKYLCIPKGAENKG